MRNDEKYAQEQNVIITFFTPKYFNSIEILLILTHTDISVKVKFMYWIWDNLSVRQFTSLSVTFDKIFYS